MCNYIGQTIQYNTESHDYKDAYIPWRSVEGFLIVPWKVGRYPILKYFKILATGVMEKVEELQFLQNCFFVVEFLCHFVYSGTCELYP